MFRSFIKYRTSKTRLIVQLTGTMFAKRKDLENYFTDILGCFVSDASKKPDILFFSDTGTTKYLNAARNGVPRIDTIKHEMFLRKVIGL